MTLAEEFRSRNFSIYGQWYRPSYVGAAEEHCGEMLDGCLFLVEDFGTGVLCMILCFALGIANIFSPITRIPFAVICLACSFVILFIEVPFLLRICPTSAKFDAFIRRFTTNYMRAAMYAAMCAIQWISLVTGASSLIAAAVVLTIAAIFYALAGLKSQEFVGSKTLGGQGVAQMIV